ncbi:hypothetical protein L914_19284 [Phytophthora nicotianae]|uniref:Uncharacterized protein n=2 Tax=Phytophthora nicotianae TaxID=4792 RepID=V9E4M1_PHYNI|nr:hypothetical protein F443_20058 [Phytophthora nicotianae P1569]ETM33494.1 hypothetical protein L914_19284 [Phytophthora nicotianae]
MRRPREKICHRPTNTCNVVFLVAEPPGYRVEFLQHRVTTEDTGSKNAKNLLVGVAALHLELVARCPQGTLEPLNQLTRVGFEAGEVLGRDGSSGFASSENRGGHVVISDGVG